MIKISLITFWEKLWNFMSYLIYFIKYYFIKYYFIKYCILLTNITILLYSNRSKLLQSQYPDMFESVWKSKDNKPILTFSFVHSEQSKFPARKGNFLIKHEISWQLAFLQYYIIIYNIWILTNVKFIKIHKFMMVYLQLAYSKV